MVHGLRIDLLVSLRLSGLVRVLLPAIALVLVIIRVPRRLLVPTEVQVLLVPGLRRLLRSAS